MPNATIYIRKEDFDRWVAIENKSGWLHKQLRGVQSSGVTSSSPPLKKEAGSSPAPPIIPKEMQPKFCKEGHPIPYGRDKCLGKGCKYS